VKNHYELFLNGPARVLAKNWRIFIMVQSFTRVIIHIDLDYFFAQIEEKDRPEYKDKPVVVCVYSGRTEDSGAVSTANYVARRFGVRSGMPIAWAKRVLKEKDAIFLPVNHDKYETVSDEIMELLRDYGQRFEQVSIDEAFIDVTERVRGDYHAAENLAKEIKDMILGRVGLTCSIGVGPNKLVSKIAANIVKPNGLTVVPPEIVIGFLRPLPVGRLFGVGRKTEKIMIEKGLKTIGELAEYPVDSLIHIFGKTLGTYFHEAAYGIDESEVQERGTPKSLSRITTLKIDTREPETILPVLESLSKAVSKRAEAEGLAYRTVALTVVAQDMSVHSKSTTLEDATVGVDIITKSVRRLFEEYLKESTLNLRRVGVRVSALSLVAGQKTLSSYLG
jgi:DNA polymerase IV (DinB-like DNA polymerase)